MLFMGTLFLVLGFTGGLVTLEAAAADPNTDRRTAYALVMLLFFTMIMTGLLMVGGEIG